MIKFIYLVILFSMIFCHIADDYYLQGVLSNMKQKKFWEKNYPDKLYKNDFYMALVEHAFSWAFSIHIPIVYFIIHNDLNCPIYLYLISMIFNIIIHATVDHQKANLLKINLITDQCVHFMQIMATWLLYISYFKQVL